jgi:co-chaperonin GroES (HSP10)
MKVINVRPCGHYIKVQCINFEEKKDSKIILPDEIKRRESQGLDVGIVIEIGKIAYKGYSGCENADDWGIKVGDYVEFGRYDGKETRASEFNENLKGIRFLNDNDIVSVWEVESESI